VTSGAVDEVSDAGLSLCILRKAAINNWQCPRKSATLETSCGKYGSHCQPDAAHQVDKTRI
jgi:hypothetical protein